MNTSGRLFLPVQCYASMGTSCGPVSVSVTSQCSIKTAERIGLVLAWELPSTYPILCYKEIQVPSKMRLFPSWTLLPYSGLRKFCHSISIVEACCQLSSILVDAQIVINWTIVCQLSWYLLTVCLWYAVIVCIAICNNNQSNHKHPVPPLPSVLPLVS